jgi:hypothetical protein
MVAVCGNVMNRQNVKHLAGRKYYDDDEVQEQVMTWFKELTADLYDSGIQ